MESNSDNELDELDYRYRKKESDKSSKMNQIIEDYKTEVANINHSTRSGGVVGGSSSLSDGRTHQLNNLRSHSANSAATANSNKLNHSMNPVIKKYLKTKDQDIHSASSASAVSHENYNHAISITHSNRKLNDLSKKSKNLKDLTKPTMALAKHTNSITKAQFQASSSSSHALNSSAGNHRPNSDKIKKPPKSPSTGLYGRQDSALDEFHIEKVVSWMTVNEDNFSELDFGSHLNDNKVSVDDDDVVRVRGGGIRSRGDDGGKSKDESTYQEIVSFIKEIEHDRTDSEDFKALKTDVEFKLNTILNSMASPENDMSINECNDDDSHNNHSNEMASNNKLK